MVDLDDASLSVQRQCELLRLSRSGVYYGPQPTDPEELALMRRIDELVLPSSMVAGRFEVSSTSVCGRELDRTICDDLSAAVSALVDPYKRLRQPRAEQDR